MKIKSSLLLILFLSITGISNAQYSFESASEYMNFIGEQYTQLNTDQWDYTKAVANNKKAKKIESKRLELLATNKAIQRKLNTLKGYNEDKTYQEAVVRFLILNYNVLNNDYEKIVNMEEIAEESYDAMEAYLTAQEQASAKIADASIELDKAREKFALANNINLIDGNSRKGEKLVQAGIVYEYYNEVFLIFFKSFKQEAYLIEATINNDVNAMEQNKNALLEYSTEGLLALKKLQPFDQDNSLIVSCREMLLFYQAEAKTSMPVIIDFYLKKEKYETVQKTFELIKKSKRTNDDINKLNQAGSEYNDAVNEYNTINETLNNTRTKKLNNWNNSTKKFTSKHV